MVKHAHIATGHGGRDRMIKEVNKKYANIPREVLGINKSYCQECQKKRKRKVDPESPVTEDADPPLMSPAPAVLLSNCIQNISNEWNGASLSQMAQAEQMVIRSKVVLGAGQVGNNVAVPIPIVYRGRGDPRNLLGVIVDLDENNMYTINVKAGILKGKFSRNQFDLCPQRLLTDADVDRTRTV